MTIYFSKFFDNFPICIFSCVFQFFYSMELLFPCPLLFVHHAELLHFCQNTETSGRRPHKIINDPSVHWLQVNVSCCCSQHAASSSNFQLAAMKNWEKCSSLPSSFFSSSTLLIPIAYVDIFRRNHIKNFSFLFLAYCHTQSPTIRQGNPIIIR